VSHILFLFSMIFVLSFIAFLVFLMTIVGPPESLSTEYFIYTTYAVIVVFMLILILEGMSVFSAAPTSL